MGAHNWLSRSLLSPSHLLQMALNNQDLLQLRDRHAPNRSMPREGHAIGCDELYHAVINRSNLLHPILQLLVKLHWHFHMSIIVHSYSNESLQ